MADLERIGRDLMETGKVLAISGGVVIGTLGSAMYVGIGSATGEWTLSGQREVFDKLQSKHTSGYKSALEEVFGYKGVADSDGDNIVDHSETLEAYEKMGIPIKSYVARDGNEVIVEPERRPKLSELTKYIEANTEDTYTVNPKEMDSDPKYQTE